MTVAIKEQHQTTRPARTIGVSGSPDYDVAIVGAGPYGLSAAAHLQAKGLAVRVFGQPMEFWAETMPEGMLLRSPREASNLSDPNRRFSLLAFQRAAGMEIDGPTPLTTFVDYGLWFRQQMGGCVDTTNVSNVRRDRSNFRVHLLNGESLTARRVVVAAGVGCFRKSPAEFAHLPSSLVSHCYEGRKIAEFTGKRVAVIGAGQSALESAALLHEAGAEVEVIARIRRLRWIGQHPRLHHLGIISKMLYSPHDVGPAGVSKLVGWPNVVRRLPMLLKDKIRKRAVRSAGSKWLPQRLTAVKISTGRSVRSAESNGDEVLLKLDDGSERRVDHVLLGTGYKVDVSRYDFLDTEMAKDIRCFDVNGYPDLATGFDTSVPGLHIIGAPAAKTFGPLMQFVAGTDFTSRALTAYIVRNRVKSR